MYNKYMKRILDIFLALLVLPFVLLTIIVLAPIIRFSDGGPVFYKAIRRGRYGKEFVMYKFRSMIVNAPEIRNEDGSIYTGANDPRVTRIGKILRTTSLDELPQFLNVLKGDMSVVGPRPALAVTPYEQLPELSKKRLEVRPGITGYAQAYYRNSISKQDKFQYDCYYVDHLSFSMDVKVLIRTIRAVLNRENIYGPEEIDQGTHNNETVSK